MVFAVLVMRPIDRRTDDIESDAASVLSISSCVYTMQPVVQPAVQPVVQRVVSCIRGFSRTAI